MKFELLARLACCLPLLFFAAAQDSVSLKLDIVAWGPQINGLSLKSGGEDQGITALPFQYSKPVAYTGSALLELHQDPAAAAKTTEASNSTAPIPPELEKRRKETPTLVALARLPAGSKRATVLIAPAASGTYQTFVIDDDPSKLPPGRLRVHNYCPIKIAVGLNGAPPRELATRQSLLVAPRDGQVTYTLAYDRGGKWRMQERNLVTIGGDEQVQFIVIKSDDDHFLSSDGSRSGFLQTVVLRRSGKEAAETAP